MLARSLVIFIAVGVVSGFMFGVYLYDIKNPNSLVFVDGPSVSVLTDKTIYKQDETVQIRVVNTGTTALTSPDSSFGFKITGLAGFVIYGASDDDDNSTVNTITSTIPSTHVDGDTDTLNNSNAETTWQILESGQQITFSWDMLKTDRTPVLAGVYKLHILAFTNSMDSTPVTASVTITVV